MLLSGSNSTCICSHRYGLNRITIPSGTIKSDTPATAAATAFKHMAIAIDISSCSMVASFESNRYTAYNWPISKNAITKISSYSIK